MPDTNQLSKYLKADNVKDGDIIEFFDAGKILEKTFERDGKKEQRLVLEITVKLRGELKTYSPNATTLKMLNKEWGTATENWVGKNGVISIIPSNNGKDMIICKPILPGTREAAQARNPDVSSEEVGF